MEQDVGKYVYIVDDDRLVRDSTHLWLSVYGYSPKTFATPHDFIEQIPLLKPGCALLDVRMPKISGLDLLEQYASSLQHLAIILMTGHSDNVMTARAKALGAVDFIEKPYKQEQLIEVIETALARLYASRDRDDN